MFLLHFSFEASFISFILAMAFSAGMKMAASAEFTQQVLDGDVHVDAANLSQTDGIGVG